MDKSVVPPYTPEMRERERRQKVSNDPFAKLPSVSQRSEHYHKAENMGSNTNPWFLPKRAAMPTWGNFNNFYGPNVNSLLTGNTEDLYDPCSTSAFSLSKTPVPESRPNLGAQSSINQQQKNTDMDTGEIPPPPNSCVSENVFSSKNKAALIIADNGYTAAVNKTKSC